MLKLSIANDFSRIPGARHPEEGAFSGDEFRDNILWPEVKKAQEAGEKLQINLDGCYGYATSFLEESFGGLVRKYHQRNLLNILTFISDEDPSLIKLINGYIKEAEASL